MCPYGWWLVIATTITTLSTSFSFPSASFPSRSTTLDTNRRALRMMADTTTNTNTNNKTPIELIPQSETGAATFPYRGEGVRVGVLDTGVCVDPASLSLGGGSSRLENAFDCTGSGDVMLRDTKATRTENGWKVEGISGRSYIIPEDWNICPFPKETEDTASIKEQEDDDDDDSKDTPSTCSTTTITVRVGIKAAYEFYPSALVHRLRRERKERLGRELANDKAALRSQLSKLQEQSKPSATDLLERENAQALLQMLDENDVEDPGPILDCIVFYDGEHVRAAIVDCMLDTVNQSQDGIETNMIATTTTTTPHTLTQSLAAFGIHKDVQTMSTSDQLHLAVQFFEKNRLLSLVVDSSPHGSHVASIIADGVAPAVRVISYKIGEPRLQSMETGPALRRALQWAVQHKCDVINLSYGESCQVPDSGHLADLAREVVWKHGIVFVAAAGNQGPALSTVKALGGTTSAVLGIGAAVSADMRSPVHSMIREQRQTDGTSNAVVGSSSGEQQQDPEQLTSYTWSSTGPAANGYLGVDLIAPGAAIAGVPSWCLQKSKLMNGTSMASPHAAACVALLISACKANAIATSPNRIRRALENTAVLQPQLCLPQQGWGLIHVPAAWEYLQAHKDDPTEDWHFHVSATGNSRGIYLRQQYECTAKRNLSVTVRPEYKMEDEATDVCQAQKVDLELPLHLSCPASWVQVPETLVLMHNGRTFDVKVDPSQLEPGLHVTRVCAVLKSSSSESTEEKPKQILFSVPITVAKPLPEQATVDLGPISFAPAEVRRHFLVPPPGSTWMDVTLRDTREADTDATSRIVAMHTLQLLPHTRFSDTECNKRFRFLPGQTHVTSIAVVEGVTVEVALARFWSTQGTTTVQPTITFRGVQPSPAEVALISGSIGVPVRLRSQISDEHILPKVKLTHWQSPLSPQPNAVVSVVGERDTLDRKHNSYELILNYEFEQEEKGSVTPKAPGIQGMLYESGLHSQCMMVFDSDKKYIGMSDAYPGAIKVPKGKMTLRLRLRHSDPNFLEKHKQLTVWIERKLGSDIPLTVVSLRKDLVTEKSVLQSKLVLRRGTTRTVFIAEPEPSKLPDGVMGGHRLVGTVNYAAGEALLAGTGKRPGGYPVTYLIGSKHIKEPTVKATPPEPSVKKTIVDKMEDAVRDTKMEYLDKTMKEDGKNVTDIESLYATLLGEYPNHLPLLGKKLRHVNETNDIVAAAEAILDRISEDDVALHFGRKIITDDGDAVTEREAMEEKKTMLIEALFAKCLVCLQAESVDADLIQASVEKLNAWVDFRRSKKYSTLFIAHEIYNERLGLALARVNDLLSSEEKGMLRPLSKKDLLEQRGFLLQRLGWTLLGQLERGRKIIAVPHEYSSF